MALIHGLDPSQSWFGCLGGVNDRFREGCLTWWLFWPFSEIDRL
jgi:hypothetical protein